MKKNRTEKKTELKKVEKKTQRTIIFILKLHLQPPQPRPSFDLGN
jgi:hypothetical protein